MEVVPPARIPANKVVARSGGQPWRSCTVGDDGEGFCWRFPLMKTCISSARRLALPLAFTPTFLLFSKSKSKFKPSRRLSLRARWRRRLLALAFAGQAQVLLMDEPMADLDPPHRHHGPRSRHPSRPLPRIRKGADTLNTLIFHFFVW